MTAASARGWPCRSSSGTTQFAATTDTPKLPAWITPSRTSRRSSTSPDADQAWRGSRGAASRTAAVTSAAARPVQYGARQSSSPTSCGVIAMARPPPAIVDAP